MLWRIRREYLSALDQAISQFMESELNAISREITHTNGVEYLSVIVGTSGLTQWNVQALKYRWTLHQLHYGLPAVMPD